MNTYNYVYNASDNNVRFHTILSNFIETVTVSMANHLLQLYESATKLIVSFYNNTGGFSNKQESLLPRTFELWHFI